VRIPGPQQHCNLDATAHKLKKELYISRKHKQRIRHRFLQSTQFQVCCGTDWLYEEKSTRKRNLL